MRKRNRKSQWKDLRANNYRVVHDVAVDMPLLQATVSSGKDGKAPTFSMNAYNGGPLRVDGWDGPVIVDLAGCIDDKRQSIPVLFEHKVSIGHTTGIEIKASSIEMTGKISGVNEQAKEVVAMGVEGFPWQGSIGVRVRKSERIPAGKEVVVNAQRFTGPVQVAREWKWKEVTFCKWGADDSTSARIAATHRKGLNMPPELLELCASLGLDAEQMNEDQVAKLKSLVATQAKPKQEGKEDKDLDASKEASGDKEVDLQARLREETAKYYKGVHAINTKFAAFPELAAKAVEEGWDEGRQDSELRAAKLDSLIKKRPTGFDAFNIKVESADDSQQVIEAALALSANVPHEFLLDPSKAFKDPVLAKTARQQVAKIDEKTLDAADKYYQGIGMQEVCLWAARKEEKYSGIWGTGEKPLRAAFSTLSLPTVFQNTLNRILLQAFTQAELTWRKIAKASSARDFRTVDKFRVYGTGMWQKLGPDGEIKHGQLGEGPKYTNQLETLAQLNVITRQDWINDDLGALNEIGAMMARYGALAPEIGLYETLLSNPDSFFHADNNNLVTSAPLTSAAGIASLTKAHLAFRKKRDFQTQKDRRNAKPKPTIAVQPKILLVPVDLEVVAWELMETTGFQSGGGESAGVRVSDKNFFKGRYEVVASPYLSDPAVHANASETSWYLLASPGDLPVLDVMFLNGNQMPIIESAEADFNTLGMQFRGYTDFGIAPQETVGAIMATA